MVNVGVVGLGAWGWNVARNFADLKECQLITCCDSDPKRTSAAKKAWPSVDIANSFEQMLSKDSLEAVVISSPAVTHYDLAKKALLADKDVFVEKPFTLSVRHAEELAELGESRKRIVMVGTCSNTIPSCGG